MTSIGARGENRRDELFGAAAGLFLEKGYDRTSVQDIADRVGLLKGSLYHYIDAKEDLLFGLIENAHKGLLDILDGLPAGDGPLRELFELARAHCLYISENQGVVDLFFNQFRSLTGARREFILNERNNYEDAWRAIFIRGQQEGEIRSDLDPQIATLGLLGLVNGVYQWFQPGGRVSAESVAEQYAKMVVGGVATSSANFTAIRR